MLNRWNFLKTGFYEGIIVENLYGVDDLEDFVQEANLAALRRGQENVLT